jgi:hypothetical protein
MSGTAASGALVAAGFGPHAALHKNTTEHDADISFREVNSHLHERY